MTLTEILTQLKDVPVMDFPSPQVAEMAAQLCRACGLSWEPQKPQVRKHQSRKQQTRKPQVARRGSEL